MQKRAPATIEGFYQLMQSIRKVRYKIFQSIINKKSIKKSHINHLKESLVTLESIRKEKGKFVLSTKEGEKIRLRLACEIGELKKDIIYIEKGKQKLLNYLAKLHNNFLQEVEGSVKILKDKKITTMIADRDGTINNYCEKYKSSIQAIYNAVFLTNFLSKVNNAIVVSSAPLNDLLKVSIIPGNKLIYAGSTGREFLTLKGKRKTYPISVKEKKILKKLTGKIEKLISKAKYKKFSLIGSGFQRKFGQLTIARQDISNSISKKESKKFLQKITAIVKVVDPKRKSFIIKDTGLDIEITLTTKGNKGFDKGEGMRFILNTLKLTPKSLLVCGDTKSDLALLKTAKLFSKKVYAIFVTTNKKLEAEVKRIIPKAIMVSQPDILVTLLDKVTSKKK